MKLEHIGLIGYGEVGKIFAAGLKPKPGVLSVAAWDAKWDAPSDTNLTAPSPQATQATQAALRAHAATAGITARPSARALCEACDFLISAVTASNTLEVAQEAARFIRPGTVFLDLNSASPGTKRQCGQAISQAGGHYVEAGVMTSVPPYGIQVPMLLGGAQATNLATALTAWEMDAKAVSEQLGVASAMKMCRSVMIKGLEALVIEAYTTARAYGVEEQVIPTLQETFPGINWTEQGAYFFSRVVEHGQRRAEEMREAANTVREAGFDAYMASATADKQDWIAQQAKAGVFDGVTKTAAWQDYADRLLVARKK